MPFKPCPSEQPESLSFTDVQKSVRSFRQALGRGERPAIENSVPTGTAHRLEIVLELVHEEMEFRLKQGEELDSRSFLERLSRARRRSGCDQRAGRGRIGFCAGGCWIGLGPRHMKTTR